MSALLQHCPDTTSKDILAVLFVRGLDMRDIGITWLRKGQSTDEVRTIMVNQQPLQDEKNLQKNIPDLVCSCCVDAVFELFLSVSRFISFLLSLSLASPCPLSSSSLSVPLVFVGSATPTFLSFDSCLLTGAPTAIRLLRTRWRLLFRDRVFFFRGADGPRSGITPAIPTCFAG